MIEEDLDYGALFILPSDAMGGAEKVLRLVALHCGRSAHKGQVWIYVLSGKQPTLSPFAAQGVNVKVVYSGKRRAFQGVPGLIRFTLSKQFNIALFVRETWSITRGSPSGISASAAASRRKN